MSIIDKLNSKNKIPLKYEYPILFEEKENHILDTEEYLIYLETEEQVKFSSSEKSKFIFLTEYFGKTPFTRQHFTKLVFELEEERGLARGTINKYILTAQYIVNYFCYYKKIKDNFLVNYPIRKRGRISKPKGDLLTDTEMKKVADCYIQRGKRLSKLDRESNLMFKTALHLMRFTGITPDEITSLKWSDDKGDCFEVYRNKNSLDRYVPIIPLIRKLLDQLPHHNHGYIFAFKKQKMASQTLRSEIKRRAKKVGIKKDVTCYSFRYSMTTWCYINADENTLAKLAKISGHTIATAHKHYVKYNIKALSDALYATHPGLIKHQSIDVVKRLAIEFLAKFIDVSKYQIELIITPKQKDVRKIHLS